MTLRDEDTIQTILAVGESGVLSLEIALSDIHCEGREWPMATGDRNRLARFGLSARSVFSGPWRCCMIYATEPTPEGVLRALAEGTRADAALLFVRAGEPAPTAPLLRELREGGVRRAVVLVDTGFPALPLDVLERAEREARAWLSSGGFDGAATPVLRGTTEGASRFRDRVDWDDSLEDDGAAYDTYEAMRVGWCEVVLTALAALPVTRTSRQIGPLWFPGGIVFACAVCGLALTRTLHEVPDPGRPEGSPRDADYVPEGCFAVSRGARDAPPGQVIVNETDVIHLHRLETSARDCCGYFPNAGGEHNLGCDNGHPVAFGWSTHWLPRFVGLDQDRVVRLDASPPAESGPNPCEHEP